MLAVAEKSEARNEGSKSELDVAIEVAFQHGAKDWVKANYPEHFKRLDTAEFEAELRQFVGH